jgi:hypothetical protein
MAKKVDSADGEQSERADATIRVSGVSDALDVRQCTFKYLIHCDHNKSVRERHAAALQRPCRICQNRAWP